MGVEQWVDAVSTPMFTGGTITDVALDGIGYRRQVLTAGGTLEVLSPAVATVLTLAGGGGGARAAADARRFIARWDR